MPNFNQLTLMGNLVRDPALSYLPSNTPVCETGIAVNRKYKKQDGEQGEETLFLDCRAFGRTAETMNRYLAKGRPVLFSGRLQLDSWQDKEGNNRHKHKMLVEHMQFLGDGAEQQSAPPQQGPPPQQAPPQAEKPNSIDFSRRPGPNEMQQRNQPTGTEGDSIPF